MAGAGRIFAVAMVITVVSVLGAYQFFVQVVQDTSSVSDGVFNATELAQLRAENRKLRKTLESVVSKNEQLMEYMKEKCWTQDGDAVLKLDNLCKTELDVCKSNLILARSERKKCTESADRLDDQRVQLAVNLSQAIPAEQKNTLRQAIQESLGEEEDELAGLLQNNGIKMDGKQVDMITSFDDEDDEDAEQIVQEAKDPEHMSNRTRLHTLLPSLFQSLPKVLRPLASRLQGDIRDRHHELDMLNDQRRDRSPYASQDDQWGERGRPDARHVIQSILPSLHGPFSHFFAPRSAPMAHFPTLTLRPGSHHFQLLPSDDDDDYGRPRIIQHSMPFSHPFADTMSRQQRLGNAHPLFANPWGDGEEQHRDGGWQTFPHDEEADQPMRPTLPLRSSFGPPQHTEGRGRVMQRGRMDGGVLDSGGEGWERAGHGEEGEDEERRGEVGERGAPLAEIRGEEDGREGEQEGAGRVADRVESRPRGEGVHREMHSGDLEDPLIHLMSPAGREDSPQAEPEGAASGAEEEEEAAAGVGKAGRGGSGWRGKGIEV